RYGQGRLPCAAASTKRDARAVVCQDRTATGASSARVDRSLARDGAGTDGEETGSGAAVCGGPASASARRRRSRSVRKPGLDSSSTSKQIPVPSSASPPTSTSTAAGSLPSRPSRRNHPEGWTDAVEHVAGVAEAASLPPSTASIDVVSALASTAPQLTLRLTSPHACSSSR